MTVTRASVDAEPDVEASDRPAPSGHLAAETPERLPPPVSSGGPQESTDPGPAPGHARSEVPWLLRSAAAWCWRILIVTAAFALLVVAIGRLRLVVIPVLAALLITALIYPLRALLVRLGLPRAAAAGLTLLIFLVVVVGALTFVVQSTTGQFSALGPQVNGGVDTIRSWLADGPLNLDQDQIQTYIDQVRQSLTNNRQSLVSGAIGGATLVVETLAGLVLALFTTFFFLYDGERIWNWFTGLLRGPGKERADAAGQAAWHTLSAYIRGTAIVAGVDSAGIGLGLVILGVPLALPLVVLTFIGAFIPLVGATLAGAAAVLVALVAKGPVTALIVLGVVLAVQQLEGHILQPFILGRSVRVHPLAIVFSIGAGSVLAGIPGAILAVPLMATVHTAFCVLARRGAYAPELEGEGEDSAVLGSTRA